MRHHQTFFLVLFLVGSLSVVTSFVPTWTKARRQQFLHATPMVGTASTKPIAATFTMKVSRGGGGEGGADSILSAANQARVSTAGKKGTKKFVDPCKVFIGNLPADAVELDIKEFLKQYMGHTMNVKSIKVIRDWKTNLSKQYGFILFTDPMFATCAMQFCKNKQLKGRILKLDQGQKKLDPNTLYVTKNKKKPVDAEEAAIQSGLAEAEQGEITTTDDAYDVLDFEDDDDAILFADENDDDGVADEDFVYDGVFEEEYPEEFEALTESELLLNREQRREAASRKKRKKLPHKGFGEPLPQ